MCFLGVGGWGKGLEGKEGGGREGGVKGGGQGQRGRRKGVRRGVGVRGQRKLMVLMRMLDLD